MRILNNVSPNPYIEGEDGAADGFFCYDEAYARSKRTRRLKIHRMTACCGSFLLCGILFFCSLTLTDTPAYDNPALFPFCAIIIFGTFLSAIIVPLCVAKSFRPYLLAVYTTFVQDLDGIWYIALTPKHHGSGAAALNQSCIANTWDSAHSRKACHALISSARSGLSVKHEFYKKPVVLRLKDLYVARRGNFLIFSYLDEYGKSCRLAVPDAFPGLPEYFGLVR